MPFRATVRRSCRRAWTISSRSPSRCRTCRRKWRNGRANYQNCIMSSDRYEHHNPEAIEDTADGDAGFMREIIGNYLESVSDSLLGLEDAVAEGDAGRTAFFAHKLKGSFAFVGADRLQGLAGKAETDP